MNDISNIWEVHSNAKGSRSHYYPLFAIVFEDDVTRALVDSQKLEWYMPMMLFSGDWESGGQNKLSPSWH